MVINPIVGVYISIIRIPIKGGMTIPNIATFDHGTYLFVPYLNLMLSDPILFLIFQSCSVISYFNLLIALDNPHPLPLLKKLMQVNINHQLQAHEVFEHEHLNVNLSQWCEPSITI